MPRPALSYRTRSLGPRGRLAIDRSNSCLKALSLALGSALLLFLLMMFCTSGGDYRPEPILNLAVGCAVALPAMLYDWLEPESPKWSAISNRERTVAALKAGSCGALALGAFLLLWNAPRS